jgi:hypothetical protein
MNDLFGQPVLGPDACSHPKRRLSLPRGYARPPGTGPAGQTCGDCLHERCTGTKRRYYHKCDIIRHRWTCGPGTDILMSAPACSMFAPKPK